MEFITKNKGLLLIMIIMLSMINLSLTKWSNTKKQSWQGGSIFALTKHNINCPNKYALTNFQAQKQGNLYWFKYICYGACNGLRKMKKSYNGQTQINDTDQNKKNSLHYLDRHNVQCKNGYSLNSVQLANKGNKIQYKFKCIETKCSKRLSYKSPTQNMGSNETQFLPRLIVKIPKSHQALTGFKFQRTSGNSFHYIINYCILDHSKPKPKPKSKNNKPTPKVTTLPKKDLPIVRPLTPASNLAVANGNKFCAKYCITNHYNRQRFCMVGRNKYGCKRCTITPAINSPEKRMICEALCNGILPNNPCTFFGWMNGNVKDISGDVLRKYGLSLLSKR